MTSRVYRRDDEFSLNSLSLNSDLTVASPAGGPGDAVLRVEMAEVRRGREVQEVSGRRGFDLRVTGEQSGPRSYPGHADLKGG